MRWIYNRHVLPIKKIAVKLTYLVNLMDKFSKLSIMTQTKMNHQAKENNLVDKEITLCPSMYGKTKLKEAYQSKSSRKKTLKMKSKD